MMGEGYQHLTWVSHGNESDVLLRSSFHQAKTFTLIDGDNIPKAATCNPGCDDGTLGKSEMVRSDSGFPQTQYYYSFRSFSA
jgi:hypothetical protein